MFITQPVLERLMWLDDHTGSERNYLCCKESIVCIDEADPRLKSVPYIESDQAVKAIV